MPQSFNHKKKFSFWNTVLAFLQRQQLLCMPILSSHVLTYTKLSEDKQYPTKFRLLSLWYVLAGRFPGEGGVVAPGMSCKYTLRFAPDSLGDYKDFIVVETQAEGPFVVPIEAWRPPPILTCMFSLQSAPPILLLFTLVTSFADVLLICFPLILQYQESWTVVTVSLEESGLLSFCAKMWAWALGPFALFPRTSGQLQILG